VNLKRESLDAIGREWFDAISLRTIRIRFHDRNAAVASTPDFPRSWDVP
jgi:hypothetical protein